MYAPSASRAINFSTTSVLMIPRDVPMSEQTASAKDVRTNMYILDFNASLRILMFPGAISMILKQNAMPVKVVSNTSNINAF